ncbi:MAG TPA: VOC family protein [Acidobacteriaceae bacterium]|nr:VOC family protein [Acidobacteriaceae bacterium]
MDSKSRNVFYRLGAWALLALCGVVTLSARSQEVERPRITGISHVGFFVSDLAKAIAFWHDFLGYDEMYTLPKKDSNDVRIAFIKINDLQHIELFNEEPAMPHNMLSHLCFTVDDIEKVRAFLRSKGYDVKPGNGSKTKVGDYAFEIKDPNGLLIEFVQRLPAGKEMQAAGKFMPETRISPRIYHVGYMVADAEKTENFYKMLGFTETWRGGANPKELSWINMKVPDGEDYVELMLYHSLPDESKWGTKNHLSLVVPDIQKAVAELESRPYYKTYETYETYGKPLTINTGVNGKRQVNLYDPDGTRVELMEPNTVTGKPAPSSTAPAPPASTMLPFKAPANSNAPSGPR